MNYVQDRAIVNMPYTVQCDSGHVIVRPTPLITGLFVHFAV